MPPTLTVGALFVIVNVHVAAALSATGFGAAATVTARSALPARSTVRLNVRVGGGTLAGPSLTAKPTTKSPTLAARVGVPDRIPVVLSVKPLGKAVVAEYDKLLAGVSASVTKVPRFKLNGTSSVAICSGISAAITGASSTLSTVIWKLCETAAAMPSETVIVTLCVPTSFWVGVPEIVAGAVNTSQLGNVGAANVSGLPSGSVAVIV